MDSPGKKSAPAPTKYLDGDQQRYPAPKTREEAGQLAIDTRYHELEKITDPKQREKAEKDPATKRSVSFFRSRQCHSWHGPSRRRAQAAPASLFSAM